MGNCIRHESSMTWGGEEWGSPISDHRRGEMTKKTMEIEEEKGLMKVDQKGFIGTSNFTTSSTEVKIKITKKQLEELLGKVDVKDMSVQQVLAQLITVSGKYQTTSLHHRSWRPALQSIPEVN